MEKIEISIELLQEIQEDLRTQRIQNMELHSQLDSVRRCLNQAEFHMPKRSDVDGMPGSISKINSVIEKALKKEKEQPKQVPVVEENKPIPVEPAPVVVPIEDKTTKAKQPKTKP